MDLTWLDKKIFIKKMMTFAGILCVIGYGISVYFASRISPTTTQEPPYLNIYNWYGMIPSTILTQFEKETGIQIRYDLYDNNETLEAKLLAGRTGYDVVFPSASPYVKRLIEAGAFQKLDKTKLKNLAHLDPLFIENMQDVDPNLMYSIPFYWGTFGFAYAEEAILERMPDAPLNSYRMLFDPNVVSKFQSCGVSLLEEPVDVYPEILIFLGLDPLSSDFNDLKIAQNHLTKVRPYISRFLGQRFISELVSGEICLAQAWSGEVQQAEQQASEVNSKMTIRYVIPEEGGSLWIDALCIPKDAPHPQNAYTFINFLLRPDISAAITNQLLCPTTNKSALSFIRKEIRNNQALYPRPDLLKRLKLAKIQNQQYEKVRTRYWFLAKQRAPLLSINGKCKPEE
ncbi:MAG: extracellular solute-binding protein [Alphaproteobacteria bacterium]|nr:extracellular solute-binding protein [Alphaproteobacteria bacterium]